MASSDSETYINGYEYECLAPRIIAEVKKRPFLYDTKQRKRSDKLLKEKLWTEVYSSLYNNWHKMSELEKKTKGDLVQKKWKNIRDCFFKELALRQGNSSQGPIKKKKYIHFDSLLFLLPSSHKKETGNIQYFPQDNDISNDSSNYSQNIDEPATLQIPSQSHTENDEYYEGYNCSSMIEYDEDISFSQMMVPMLRKLNDDQKHYARIEIMTILQKARFLSK